MVSKMLSVCPAAYTLNTDTKQIDVAFVSIYCAWHIEKCLANIHSTNRYRYVLCDSHLNVYLNKRLIIPHRRFFSYYISGEYYRYQDY